MEQLTVYDLFGEDMSITANLANEFQVNMKIYDENDEVVYDEVSHLCGWESAVNFAKKILMVDQKIMKQRGDT